MLNRRPDLATTKQKELDKGREKSRKAEKDPPELVGGHVDVPEFVIDLLLKVALSVGQLDKRVFGPVGLVETVGHGRDGDSVIPKFGKVGDRDKDPHREDERDKRDDLRPPRRNHNT